MEYIFIYLLQICNVFFCSAWVLLALSAICYVAWGVIMDDADGCLSEKLKKECLESANFAKKYAGGFLVLSLILFLFPTKQTLLLLGGTYYGKKAVKQIVTDKKIEKINTIIELELDKRIKELKEN